MDLFEATVSANFRITVDLTTRPDSRFGATQLTLPIPTHLYKTNVKEIFET